MIDEVAYESARTCARHDAAPFFRRSTAGIALGIPALASLLARDGFAAADGCDPKTGGLLGFPNFAAQGQAGDLPAPVRRALADRSV